MNKRNCPACGVEMSYKDKYVFRKAVKRGSLCKSCGVKKQYMHDPFKNRGNRNGRYGRKLKDVMIEKYGVDLAKTKYDTWKSNLNTFKSGELNPQFGKSASKKSGMSYKGWYNGIFFRSSFELLFLVQNSDKVMIPADNLQFVVEYMMDSVKYRYYPDFYCEENNTVYEVKSHKWSMSQRNIEKSNYAKVEFANRGIKYEMVTEHDIPLYAKYNSWRGVIFDFMYDLYLSGEISLTDISDIKFRDSLRKTNRIDKLNLLSK